MKMPYFLLPNYIWNSSGSDICSNVLWSYSCRTMESEDEDNKIVGIEKYCHSK